MTTDRDWKADVSTVSPSSIRSNEGLMLKTSAFQSLYGGQFTSSTLLINQISLTQKSSLTKKRQNWVIIREISDWDTVQTQESLGLMRVESLVIIIRTRNCFTSSSPLWNSLNLGCNLEKKHFRFINKLYYVHQDPMPLV